MELLHSHQPIAYSYLLPFEDKHIWIPRLSISESLHHTAPQDPGLAKALLIRFSKENITTFEVIHVYFHILIHKFNYACFITIKMIYA